MDRKAVSQRGEVTCPAVTQCESLAELGAESRLTLALLCSSQHDMGWLKRQHLSTFSCSLQSIPLISQIKLDS